MRVQPASGPRQNVGSAGRAGCRHASAAVKNDPVHVIFVCTGNICRSPTGGRLASAFSAWDPIADFRVSSASARAVIAHPINPEAAGVLHDLDGGTAYFTAPSVHLENRGRPVDHPVRSRVRQGPRRAAPAVARRSVPRSPAPSGGIRDSSTGGVADRRTRGTLRGVLPTGWELTCDINRSGC